MSESLPPPRIDLLVHSPTPGPLKPVLETLLEPSPALSNLLVPQLHQKLQSQGSSRPKSYKELLQLAQSVTGEWDIQDQASFLSAHPRIGETKNLSNMSGNEQGGQTPGEVLKRLQILNSLYEESYPGLRYITFVNGRSRAQIIPELEGILGLKLPEPGPNVAEPKLSELRGKVTVQIEGSQAWRAELKRGMNDMWQIAQSRLSKLGVQ